MTSQIDVTKPVFGTPTTQSVRDNFTTAANEITGLQSQTALAPFLPLAGGRMTGVMYLFNDPTDVMMPATKGYVDAQSGSGGGGIPEAPADSTTYGRNNGAWIHVLPLAGGTLTGPLLLAADPTAALGAVTKQYVDAIQAALPPEAPNDASYYARHQKAWAPVLALAGGAVTGATSFGAVTIPAGGFYPALYSFQLNMLSGIQFNAYNSTATQANYLTAGTAGAGVIQMDGNARGMSFYVQAAGAKDAPITWNAPIFFDLKGNISNTTAVPVIPTDNVNRIISTTDLTLPVAGGHICFNTYLATPTTWKYLNANYAGHAFMDANGAMQFLIYATGAAGATLPAASASMVLNLNGILNVPTVSAATLVQSNGGRVVSTRAGGTPSVSCWDQTAVTATGMWNPGSAALRFGSMDGSGVPQASWVTMSAGGMFVGGTADFGFSYASPVRYVSFVSGWAFSFDTGPCNLTFLNGLSGAYNVAIAGANGQCSNIDGVWHATSDIRIKQDIADYTTGIEAIRALRPRTFRLMSEVAREGSDATEGAVVGTAPTRIGLIAQECEVVMPETVTLGAQTVDGVEYTDLRSLNSGPVTWALVNAVKQLDARLAALEGQP